MNIRQLNHEEYEKRLHYHLMYLPSAEQPTLTPTD